jgi:uncharacterized protein YaaN involved in tellurite resistance
MVRQRNDGNAGTAVIEQPRLDQMPSPEALAAKIDPTSLASIASFGGGLRDQARYTDDLLQKANGSDLDAAGEKLGDIIALAKQFNINSLDNPYSRIPVLGGLFRSLAMSKQRTVARFQSVKTQVEALASSVESTAAQLARRDRDYEEMYRGLKTERDYLGVCLAALEIAIGDAQRRLIERDHESSDIEEAERKAVLTAGIHALQKRRDDITVLKQSALQMLPMIRVVQSNNLALTDKFATIQTLTVPAWKRTFLMWLAMQEQQETVKLANSIDDATNEFLKANADLLHENSVATARSSQRLVIDIETLKHVHDKIIDTLTDVQAAYEAGAEERADAVREIARMHEAMLRGEKVGTPEIEMASA